MTWKSENFAVHWKNQSWFGTCISSNQKVSEWSTVNYYVASLLQDKNGKNNNNDCLVIKSAWYKLFSKLKIKSSTHYCTQEKYFQLIHKRFGWKPPFCWIVWLKDLFSIIFEFKNDQYGLFHHFKSLNWSSHFSSNSLGSIRIQFSIINSSDWFLVKLHMNSAMNSEIHLIAFCFCSCKPFQRLSEMF